MGGVPLTARQKCLIIFTFVSVRFESFWYVIFGAKVEFLLGLGHPRSGFGRVSCKLWGSTAPMCVERPCSFSESILLLTDDFLDISFLFLSLAVLSSFLSFSRFFLLLLYDS